jgi:hypothetical protein
MANGRNNGTDHAKQTPSDDHDIAMQQMIPHASALFHLIDIWLPGTGRAPLRSSLFRQRFQATGYHEGIFSTRRLNPWALERAIASYRQICVAEVRQKHGC